jgi:uncharacterized membrane protein
MCRPTTNRAILGSVTRADVPGDRRLAVVAHAAFFIAPVVLPLVLYLCCQRRKPWVAAHAALSFNFQLSFGLALFGLIGLASLPGTLGPVAIVAAIGVWIMGTASAVAGISRAARDVLQPYPASIPFIPRVRLPASADM